MCDPNGRLLIYNGTYWATYAKRTFSVYDEKKRASKTRVYFECAMSVQVVGGTLVQKAISGFAKSHKMFLERYKQAGWNPESAVLPYYGLGTSILSGEFQEVYQALV